jgi:hypothetical protein
MRTVAAFVCYIGIRFFIFILIFTFILPVVSFSLFNATQRDADFALRASKAYQEIVDALEGAKVAAVNASIAADIAHKKVSIVKAL